MSAGVETVFPEAAMSAWIDRHTFYCVELDASVSESACARYRKGFQAMNSKGKVFPLACQGCAHKVKAEPLKREKKRFKSKR